MFNIAMALTPTVKIFPKYQQNTTLLTSFITIIDNIVKIILQDDSDQFLIACPFFINIMSYAGSNPHF